VACDECLEIEARAHGSELARVRLPPGDPYPAEPGPACVGDLDGDGTPEIGVLTQTAVNVYSPRGVLQWSVPADDPSTSAECSTFDFDADGPAELLVLDQDRFAILRGTDGAVLFEDRTHP
jgi:hypothetical protein